MCENDMQRNGNLGLKMGVSPVTYTYHAIHTKVPPTPEFFCSHGIPYWHRENMHNQKGYMRGDIDLSKKSLALCQDPMGLHDIPKQTFNCFCFL